MGRCKAKRKLKRKPGVRRGKGKTKCPVCKSIAVSGGTCMSCGHQTSPQSINLDDPNYLESINRGMIIGSLIAIKYIHEKKKKRKWIQGEDIEKIIDAEDGE